LIGLKENVIIGKLIPAGTGMSRYRNIEVEKLLADQEDGDFDDILDLDLDDLDLLDGQDSPLVDDGDIDLPDLDLDSLVLATDKEAASDEDSDL
jgi:hypothetical protein